MRPIILFAVVAILTACATSDVLVLDPAPRPARSPDSVAVLLDEPSRQYRSIALVEVSDDGWDLSLAKLGNRMKREAARLGGDAVIIGTPSNTSSAVIIPVGTTLVSGSSKEKKLVGKVIVYVDQPR